jgi:Tol biopolymer transport system component
MAGQALEAQQRKLNAPLRPNGDVKRFIISADHRHALYVADQDKAGELLLLSVRLDIDAAPVEVEGVLIPEFHFSGVPLTSSLERVVFGGNVPGKSVEHLYSAPIEGGTAVRLNPPFVSGGNLAFPNGDPSTSITPDGTRVVYVADQEVDGRDEVYVVPIDGSGTAIKLNHALSGTWSVKDAAIDPTGTGVAYSVGESYSGSGFATQVYWVPLDGSSGPVLLAEHQDSSARKIEFSADGQWVTYSSSPSASPTPDLYLVPRDASQVTVKLNSSGFTSLACDFTPAQNRVVYFEHRPYLSTGGWFTQYKHLSSATFDGNGTRLYEYVEQYVLSPDGHSLFFTSDWTNPPVAGLFHVPVDGSAAPTELVGDRTEDVAISGDGTRIVYTRVRGLTWRSLYSMPSTGGVPNLLHDVVHGPIRLSDDSRFVIYRAGVSSSVASQVVVFSGDLETNNRTELFSCHLEPWNRSASIAPPMQPSGGR